VIAEYLEQHHGTPTRSLFYSPEGKTFAKFLETWANTDLANELRPFIKLNAFINSDPDVQAWLIEQRQGGDDSKLKAEIERLNHDAEWVEQQAAAARTKLQTLETHLAALASEGKGPFVAGEKITHGDAVIFGWYASSQGRKEIGTKIWRHESLPRVGEWVDAVVKATGVNP
jgi:glutathione S-transferase